MIRVLRLMEYEFESYDTMEKHLANCAVPMNGAKNFGADMIRSVQLIVPSLAQLIVPSLAPEVTAPPVEHFPDTSEPVRDYYRTMMEKKPNAS